MLENIAMLENALGIPSSAGLRLSHPQAVRRLANLRSLAASRIDPDDNGEQHAPILWGEWLTTHPELA